MMTFVLLVNYDALSRGLHADKCIGLIAKIAAALGS